MPKLIDLTGQRFGKLVVQSRTPNNSYPVRWTCHCDCGATREVQASSLRSGASRSCGCSHVTHRRSKTKEYAIWQGMLNRCKNPNVNRYELYGGRGIKVCERWQSFENFFSDMGERPSPSHSIDRINPDGNYEPSNCRWATSIEQANNRGKTRFVIYRGKEMSLTDAVRAAGSLIHYEAAWIRIAKCGWSVERAVETPRTKESPNSKSRSAA